MQYLISHVTEYAYSAPIAESLMEVRMMPRSEAHQRCWRFRLTTKPRSNVMFHQDFLGNAIHHFSIPAKHSHLCIHAESLVVVSDLPEIPEALGPASWRALDEMTRREDHWDMLSPSKFARPTPTLEEFAREIGLERADDPLTVLKRLNATIYKKFDYVPKSTRVDSPIDEALSQRQGVCQDYAHVMIALIRQLGIPCRYVSGYLFHRVEDQDRSADDATHAWVEACLPDLGWIGFDPTNNLLVGTRHIRVAVGRDYADVPPTRGVFKGDASSELSVVVKVAPSQALVLDDEPVELPYDQTPLMDYHLQQQQQQQ